MSRFQHLIRTVLIDFEWFVLGYFVVLNTLYLVLTLLAAMDFTKYLRRVPYAGHDDIFANPLTPGVSVVVPAHNEAPTIADNVRAMLSLRFPLFEVVVVDDGSTDGTFEVLQETWDLVQVPRQSTGTVPTMGSVLSVHVPRQGDPLVVVRKDNTRSKADALNVGLNLATMPLVCMVDADSLLDSEALLRVVKPFVDDPQRVVATGGVVRPANGCRVEQGHVVEAGMPRNWWARIEVVEYLRSFLLGRSGWSTLQGLLIISGAFSMFRRDLVMELGGLDPHCIGEDAELVARLHRHVRTQGPRKYRFVFVSEPVCWTQVPTTARVLARQRRRWSRGLAELLWKHRSMIGNPRYGRIGLVVLPYYLIFELLGPVVEIVGLVALVAGLALHMVGTWFAVLFGLAAVGYGVLLSIAALTVEEFSFHRMSKWKDLLVALAASVLENIGYRQLHSLWRIQGLWSFLRHRESTWGVMTRTGFASSPSAAQEAATSAEKPM